MKATLIVESHTVLLRVYISQKERTTITLGAGTAAKYRKEERRANSILKGIALLDQPPTIATFLHYFNNQPATRQSRRHARRDAVLATDITSFLLSEINNRRYSAGTKKHAICTVDALERFGKIRVVRDLTPANVVAFDVFLRAGTGRSDATVANYHKKIKSLIHNLVASGTIPDPYASFHYPAGRNKERAALSVEELHILRAARLTGGLAKARDLFIFGCFTGIAYADIQRLNYSRDVVTRDGLPFIDSHRIKTTNRYFTPVLPPAVEVWESYKYKLPVLSLQRANIYLHAIRAAYKIHTPLTTHVARHTFATHMLAKGIPITSLAHMLGHTKIETTRRYAKTLDTTIIDDVRKAFASPAASPLPRDMVDMLTSPSEEDRGSSRH